MFLVGKAHNIRIGTIEDHFRFCFYDTKIPIICKSIIFAVFWMLNNFGNFVLSFPVRRAFAMTPFFVGGSVLCATNRVVRSFFGQAMLYSFCSRETQQKNNSFSLFLPKNLENHLCKSGSFIGLYWNY